MSKVKSESALEVDHTIKIAEWVEVILLFSISQGISWYLDVIQLPTTPIMIGLGMMAAGISMGFYSLETILIGCSFLTILSVLTMAFAAIILPVTWLKILSIALITLLVGGTSGSVMFWLTQRRLFISFGRQKGIIIASLTIALGLLFP